VPFLSFGCWSEKWCIQASGKRRDWNGNLGVEYYIAFNF
jgi:hypothetical protein